MPIGKQSINRVAKKADTEEIKTVVEQQPIIEKKPSTAKKSTSGATRAKSTKAAAPKQTTPVGGDVLDTPIVTEHVIANIAPAVVEAVVGKETPAPKDGKVKLTDPMPSYLL